MMNNIKSRILKLAKSDTDRIEKAIEKNLENEKGIVADAAQYIIFSGGKRLRPLLMILSARLCGYKGENDDLFSIIFEYLHTATLLHDDIIDGALIRRKKRVANKVWNTRTAILTGDFLLARSLSVAALMKKSEAISVMAGIMEDMAKGEIEQLNRQRDITLSEEDCIFIIKCKTAVLIEGACKIGAIISDAKQEKTNCIAKYGYNIGMAFQMADDLLDYTSATSVLGKETGTDLKEGKLTLPLIYALNAAEPEDKKKIESIITNKDFNEKNFNILVRLLHKYKGIDYTRNKAEEHIKIAKKALETFEDSDTKEILSLIADYSMLRKS
ncbi:MAG: polyprenyl synthetase family protein [Deltaproteobacteria bacterium]|nr:polyprenyl synthetase family protein [Deltaproteobacteria bacterium]